MTTQGVGQHGGIKTPKDGEERHVDLAPRLVGVLRQAITDHERAVSLLAGVPITRSEETRDVEAEAKRASG
jgi:hypothetical protein